MLDLAAYGVSPLRGFLPDEDPLAALPPAFAQWDELGRELPALILTGRVRSAVDDLDAPDLDLLTTPAELERAMLIISAIGMADIWAQEQPATVVPARLAIPWTGLADRVGRPPIITHASVVLNNWRRLDPDGGLDADNLACLQHFMGGMDEQWFFTSTAALEAAGAPVLRPLVEAKEGVANGDVDRVLDALEVVSRVLDDINRALLRVNERCDPYIFYHRIRPFLTGWDQTGLRFDGVNETPLHLHGGSAAQSSLIQAIDAGLGIEHRHPETLPFLTLMRDYMPPGHRRFIEDLAAGPSVSGMVAGVGSSAGLVEVFNHCVDQLDRFRRAHLAIAVRYIQRQGPGDGDAVGTGGTSFVPFLRQSRVETTEARVQVDDER